MNEDDSNLTAKIAFKAILNATLCSFLYIGIPYLATLMWNFYKGTNIVIDLKLLSLRNEKEGYEASKGIVTIYSFSLILILPLFQGILIGYKISPYKKKFGAPFSIALAVLMINILIAALFFHEGYICLLIGFPLFFLIIGLGIILGRWWARALKKKTLQVTLLPLLAAFVIHDTNSIPNYTQSAISDSVTINASPDIVWHYIVDYPENKKPPEYWLWKIGLPAPIRSVAADAKVGAERKCQFTNGIEFKEKITEIQPNKVLTFDVVEQPKDPEIIGHFSLDKGQLYLVANKDGTTTVVATSWYRVFIKPTGYFGWWAEDIVRNVHYRVLNHMKELAEKEQMTIKL